MPLRKWPVATKWRGLVGCAPSRGRQIGGRGAEASPGIDDAGIGESGHERRGPRVQGGDVGGMDGLVEAGVLDGGADDGAAGLRTAQPRNDVEVFGAEGDVERKLGWNREREHLAFDGNDGVGGFVGAGGLRVVAEVGCLVARLIRRPGAAAVDELRGFDGATRGFDADRVGRCVRGAHGRVREELDVRRAYCGEERWRQLTGIDGMFAQELEAIERCAGCEELCNPVGSALSICSGQERAALRRRSRLWKMERTARTQRSAGAPAPARSGWSGRERRYR